MRCDIYQDICDLAIESLSKVKRQKQNKTKNKQKNTQRVIAEKKAFKWGVTSSIHVLVKIIFKSEQIPLVSEKWRCKEDKDEQV